MSIETHDSIGMPLPAGFDGYQRAAFFDAGGLLAFTIASGPGGTFVQSVTREAGQPDVMSFWVKKALQELPDVRVLGASLISSLGQSIGTDALPQVFPTYASLQAAITAGQFSAPRSVVVTADETNDNTRTFYNWDGAALQWVPTVDI